MKQMDKSDSSKFTFREAKVVDVEGIQIVRRSVIENVLTTPELVTDEICLDYMVNRGKAWVCENAKRIIGFSIVDLSNNSVWALFVDPDFEKKGIGSTLHKLMLNWYFNQTNESICLGTDPDTRAELFYRNAGWSEVGRLDNGEIKFEMSFDRWKRQNI